MTTGDGPIFLVLAELGVAPEVDAIENNRAYMIKDMQILLSETISGQGMARHRGSHYTHTQVKKVRERENETATTLADLPMMLCQNIKTQYNI